jgi:hypothetical protein
MVQFIIFGLKFIGTFSLRNCDCLNEVSFTILEKVSINSKNYNLLHRFLDTFSKKVLSNYGFGFFNTFFRKQILQKPLKQYKGTPDSSGLFIRQAQS